jgi:hypothetical protein
MKKHAKWTLISALVAAVLEASLLFAVRQPSNGPNVFTLCTLPFFVLASACGDNLGGIVFYVSIFLFFFGITYLTHLIWMLFAKDASISKK